MDKPEQKEGWYLTKSLKEKFEQDEEFAIQILECMAKFLKHDWGITCKEDCKHNDRSVKTGDSIVAKYETKLGNIFIITEKGQEITNILFTNEY